MDAQQVDVVQSTWEQVVPISDTATELFYARLFDVVGATLLWTLEQGLGEAWSSEAEQAWCAANSILASTMLEAAATAEAA
jgi:hemoglobin-like flavoprotein